MTGTMDKLLGSSHEDVKQKTNGGKKEKKETPDIDETEREMVDRISKMYQEATGKKYPFEDEKKSRSRLLEKHALLKRLLKNNIGLIIVGACVIFALFRAMG